MNEEEAKERAHRIMKMREALVNSLPDDAMTIEAILAGLTTFYQAMFHLTEGDKEDMETIMTDSMNLARQMYEHECAAEENASGTVH